LQSLRALTIFLNDCGTIAQCSGSVQPLASVTKADKMILDQWERICRRFSENIPPSQLRLCIISDCKDLDTARDVARIASTLPLLHLCAIRFSTSLVEPLKELAKQTVLHLTGQDVPLAGAFQFFHLPKEI